MTTLVIEPSLWFLISTNLPLLCSVLCDVVSGPQDWIHADLEERPAHRS